jgi:hypothetical protein
MAAARYGLFQLIPVIIAQILGISTTEIPAYKGISYIFNYPEF